MAFSRPNGGFISAFFDPLKTPNAPTIGTATAGNASISITFTAPSNVGGSAITGYIATAYNASGNTVSATGSASPINITGLTNGTAYTVKVAATNSFGTGPLSSASSSVSPAVPVPAIGSAYGGGFFAGQINVSGTIYNLVIAPKATGESTRTWGVAGVATGITSVIDGPANSAALAALGSSYQAATFCEGLTIGGYNDWYLPAKNEFEVLYYFLKPTTDANETSAGSNANAVSPEPISTNYTSSSPAQTISGIGFRVGETNALAAPYQRYWCSTDYSANYAWITVSHNGAVTDDAKYNNYYTRAVRRVLA